MEYLMNDLYVRCFDGYLFDENDDKILIGILNNDRSKLKDVATGEIIDAVGLHQLMDFRKSEFGGNDMALGYMTGHRASTASIYQKMLAEFIDLQLSGEVIDTKNIARVKSILNREIKKNHLRELKEEEQKVKLGLSEEERDF